MFENTQNVVQGLAGWIELGLAEAGSRGFCFALYIALFMLKTMGGFQ